MNPSMKSLQAWLVLSRPPFHTVGLLPFFLGGALAWHQGADFRGAVLGWGVLGVFLIMLATYCAGEYWDQVEDALSMKLGASHFAGGSQVVQRGLLPRHAPLWASLTSLALALAVGFILRYHYGTGPWTIPLGLLGMVGGFFYSAEPLRWVSRGWGELWIAFCYGWLPVAVGCYLQVGSVHPAAHWMSVPIGLSIFNVILLNEFPDYPADLSAGKANLTVRLGPEKAARLYVLVSVAVWLSFLLSLGHAMPLRAWWYAAPILVLSLILVGSMLRGLWRDRIALERLCAANLLVNLGITSVYILALMR